MLLSITYFCPGAGLGVTTITGKLLGVSSMYTAPGLDGSGVLVGVGIVTGVLGSLVTAGGITVVGLFTGGLITSGVGCVTAASGGVATCCTTTSGVASGVKV